jgi:malate dehydrogenase (oxaloacetate-decarboxylating)
MLMKPVDKTSEEEMLKKAYEPARLAMVYHPFYEGKIEITAKCPVRNLNDFAIWYTPGVAEPCKDIQKNPDRVYDHTSKGNMVAVISDGTRVLGLGDIGPEAGLPVMEGKALLFKYLGGVDAVPICLATKDTEEIIRTVKVLAPSFGGINLEDISNPKCFEILDRLRAEMDIPVWHDDQQGTATIVTAGAINAHKVVGKKISESKVAMVGAGAANIAISRVMVAAGFNLKNIIMVDSKGTLHRGRDDIKGHHAEKWFMCENSNAEGVVGGIEEAMKGADILVAASRPGPGVIKKEWVAGMANDAIVFATANPIPEIFPDEAKAGGARVIATGRSDFPNQINNVLAFPGVFRGTFDVRASDINDEMKLAAAYALADLIKPGELNEEYIIPAPFDPRVKDAVAKAVAQAARDSGVARI